MLLYKSHKVKILTIDIILRYDSTVKCFHILQYFIDISGSCLRIFYYPIVHYRYHSSNIHNYESRVAQLFRGQLGALVLSRLSFIVYG